MRIIIIREEVFNYFNVLNGTLIFFYYSVKYLRHHNNTSRTIISKEEVFNCFNI